jgi:hypothetical protein
MSYEKLINGFETSDQRIAHEKEWGNFNDPLPNMVEITIQEFAQSGFFTWCITAQEFRQVDPNRINKSTLSTLSSPITTMLSLRIFYTNGPMESGFALSNDYWDKKIRYFKFAKCFHVYEELSVEEAKKAGVEHFGMCYHVCKCKNCGMIHSYDSSG